MREKGSVMADFDTDIADFEAKVDQNIKLLGSKKAETRRAAVLWLGESGEPHVIEPLVKLYNREKDAGVKSALVYSLGKFRALQQALDRGEDDKVLDLLKRVTNEGKVGKRLGIPTRTMVMIMVGLLISFVILIGAFFATDGMSLFSGGEIIESTEVADSSTAGSTPLPQLITEVNGKLSFLRTDLNTLQAQYQAAADGTFSEGNCIAFFNNATPYTLSDADKAAYPALDSLVERLNTAIEDFTSAKSTLDTACQAAAPALTADEAAEPLQSIASIQSELTSIELDLSELQASTMITPTVATEEAAPTEDEAATEEPPTATPVPGADPRSHIAPLSSLIDDMTTVRGPAVLLQQYWTDVSNSGTTGGCGQPDPQIPEDYEIPQEAATASPALQDTVEAINLGLQLLREGWRDFRNACNNNSLSAGLSRGNIAVNAINTTFTSARNQLNAVRTGG